MATQDKILADEIDKLEQKKLNDMKNLLKEFTHIQVIFHAKALEMLTTAYKHLVEIDTESDLEEFRNTFTQSNLKNLQFTSNKSLNESGRTKNSYEELFSGGSLPSTPGRSRNNLNKSLEQNRSKSNDVKRNTASTSNLTQQQKNSRNFASAPDLNGNKKRNSSNYDDDDDVDDIVEDVTDDSDAE